MERSSQTLIRLLEREGSQFMDISGDYHQFRLPMIAGRITVPHPRSSINIRTLYSIYRQMGWQKRKP